MAVDRHVVYLQIRFRIQEGKRSEFEQLCDDILERSEESCLDRRLFREIRRPSELLWLETWTDREALSSSLRSTAHRALMGAIGVLGAVDAVRITRTPADLRRLASLRAEDEEPSARARGSAAASGETEG
jgi:quinol monooxygenase YgiN